MYFQVDGTNLRLLGTIHVLPPAFQGLPAWVTAAADWSQDLIVESFSEQALPALLLGDGSTLQDHLPAPLYVDLARAWGDAPAAAPLSAFKPWAALILLGLRQTQFSQGIEPRIRAQCDGTLRKAYFLETGEQFAAPLDALSDSVYPAVLRDILSRLAEVRPQMESMVGAWLRSDSAGLFSIAAKMPLWGEATLKDILFTRRHSQWMNSIRLALNSNRRSLLAIGALHLMGDGNLCELIRQAGYNVTPLPTT